MFNSGYYDEKVNIRFYEVHNSTNLTKKQRKARKNKRRIASKIKAKNR